MARDLRTSVRRIPRPAQTALGVASWFVLAGCLGTPVLPGDGSGSNGDGGSGGGGSGGGGSPTPITAQLNVSNPSPGLGEEVVLTCAVSPTPDGTLTYSFEPMDRLSVDARRGTARFIVDATDIGPSFSFRCSATDGEALTVRSPVRSVIPTL